MLREITTTDKCHNCGEYADWECTDCNTVFCSLCADKSHQYEQCVTCRSLQLGCVKGE